MPYTVEKIESSKFIEYSPYFCLGINFFLFLILFLSNFWTKTLINRTVSTKVVEGDTIAKLEPILLKASLIGALRVDAKAIIRNNSWLTYEIQFQDEQGNVVVSALKPAWKESGTWREGGESGYWQEEDLWGGIDLRLPAHKKQQLLTPVIQVLEYTDTQGIPITKGLHILSFKVKIIQGAIDIRYLWAGVIGTTLMTILCFYSLATTGKLVIKKKLNDSDVGDRAILGEPNQLVKATIKVVADETCPSSLNINLWLNDGYGDECCHLTQLVRMNYRRNDDREIVSARGTKDFYFLLPKRTSYNFYVEVEPDQPVERTCLSVKEQVKTLGTVEINQISYSVI